jgi:GNAT superfamily N-acetyltransferase
MESTEHALGPRHIAGCLALSKAAHWNQNEADWRLMLSIGRGWGISLADGTLAASTLVLPYGKDFAWVSMVLVLPEHRRQGYASQLLRVAIADLEKDAVTPVLDATPAGREVYRQEGFHDTWGFKRFSLRNAAGKKHPAVREVRERDWPSLLTMDRAAFGASREMLLRSLWTRLPEAGLVFQSGNTIRGFLLGREGRESRQLGPLIADSAEVAKALLETGLERVAAPLYIDLADHAPELAQGFEYQRPFTRMVHGVHGAPGNERAMFLVAGPELG